MLISVGSKASVVVLIYLVSAIEKGKKKVWAKVKYKWIWNPVLMVNGFAFPCHKMLFVFFFN